MIVLGINPGHNSTAALFKDGKIVAMVSEEKFSRIKNYLGMPYKSIDYCLDYAKITKNDVDLVVIAGTNPRSQMLNITANGLESPVSSERGFMASLSSAVPKSVINVYSDFKWKNKSSEIKQMHADKLGFPIEKIEFLDHHTAHALSCAFNIKPNTLVLTLDGEGDGYCGTVSVFDGKNLNFISKTSQDHSLGLLYMYVTIYLGMKPNEHEFKVMGLEPYAKGERINECKKVFDELIWLKENSLEFDSKMNIHECLPYLYEKLRKYRFDYVAAAVQRKTEELVTEWVKRAIKTTGLNHVAVSGGVFMNVKVNMLVNELPEVEDLFICPSPGDESLPFGCIYYGVKKLNESQSVEPLARLYLGPEYSNDYVKNVLSNDKRLSNYKIEYHEDIESVIADLLANGKIVARMKGRCEWGARALGNRSIIADPRNLDIVKIINEQIKSRDFWMPFAPSMLADKSDKYLINPKHSFAPWMIIAFNTKPQAKIDIPAALHAYDLSARPQFVTKELNPEYYKIISLFESKTGISGVLNTSFNLHGEPIVCSPEDAIHTFLDSGLEYVAIENYLLSKQ
ncbi:Uncharacterised protein [uncultured archaeon]|nr:Uncharacterised protein [uncultured archaeon]